MRSFGLTLAALVLLGSAAAAQEQPAASPERLDELLTAWEERMGTLQSLYTECSRSLLDNINGTTKEMTGSARFLKPNKARLRLEESGDPDAWELYIATGEYLYEYQPKEQIVRVHEIPQRQGNNVGEDTFLSFLFGMKAGEAKKRYDIQLAKEDDNYAYLNIFPKFGPDKQEFARAQLVIWKRAEWHMLPCRLWFEHPNGDQTTWMFNKIMANPQLKESDFVAPQTPEGWQMIRAEKPDEGQ